MKIDFSTLFSFNSASQSNTAQAPAGLVPQGSFSESVKKSGDMDIVSFSDLISKELKSRAEELRQTLQADQIDPASVKGSGAEGLKIALQGTEDVLDTIDQISEKVALANSNELTEKDKAEVQKEIEWLLEQINRTAEAVGEYSPYGALLTTSALGLDDLNILTQESALQAVGMIDEAILRVKNIQRQILEELNGILEGQYTEKLETVTAEISKLEALKQAEMDKLLNEGAPDPLTVEDTLDLDKPSESKPQT